MLRADSENLLGVGLSLVAVSCRMEETVCVATLRTGPVCGTYAHERGTATQRDTSFSKSPCKSNIRVAGIVAGSRNEEFL